MWLEIFQDAALLVVMILIAIGITAVGRRK